MKFKPRSPRERNPGRIKTEMTLEKSTRPVGFEPVCIICVHGHGRRPTDLTIDRAFLVSSHAPPTTSLALSPSNPLNDLLLPSTPCSVQFRWVSLTSSLHFSLSPILPLALQPLFGHSLLHSLFHEALAFGRQRQRRYIYNPDETKIRETLQINGNFSQRSDKRNV